MTFVLAVLPRVSVKSRRPIASMFVAAGYLLSKIGISFTASRLNDASYFRLGATGADAGR